MKTVILGAGAMGSVIGGALAQAGNDVILVDVAKEIVEAIEQRGLVIEDKAGQKATVRLKATNDPTQVGLADLIIVFVKCYHTETAVRQAAPMLGPNTIVLSLQNGWGNATLISKLTDPKRLLVGVSYHSAVLLAPGHVRHAGQGPTYLGELDGAVSARVSAMTELFGSAGIEITPSANVLGEIWSKLALNVVTLPTSAAVRITADKLLRTSAMERLMRELLSEVVAVANAQKISLNFDERWNAIRNLLNNLAPKTKGSMLQDVEQRRQTEIDVINGAIVDAGARLGIATPYNQSMICLIKALEGSFAPSS
jgi:2-dehydropantoate 2-reductase